MPPSESQKKRVRAYAEIQRKKLDIIVEKENYFGTEKGIYKIVSKSGKYYYAKELNRPQQTNPRFVVSDVDTIYRKTAKRDYELSSGQKMKNDVEDLLK
jgi:hypothetical protein